jgi:DNA-binding response OmpR family regulator
MAKRVLVVDDELAISALLEHALVKAGYSVSTASGGRECLEAVAETPPDLVILDVVMPGMDGFEVLRTLRQAAGTKLLPVILLTGRGEHEDKLEGWMGGADRYLTKPCQASAVVAAVKTMLDSPPPRPGRD